MATLTKGSDKTLRIVFRLKSEEPIDLTDCTAIVATFVGDDGEVTLTKAASEIQIMEPAGSGIIQLTLSNIFTLTLKAGERQTFQVKLTIGSKQLIHTFQDVLNVQPLLGSE